MLGVWAKEKLYAPRLVRMSSTILQPQAQVRAHETRWGGVGLSMGQAVAHMKKTFFLSSTADAGPQTTRSSCKRLCIALARPPCPGRDCVRAPQPRGH